MVELRMKTTCGKKIHLDDGHLVIGDDSVDIVKMINAIGIYGYMYDAGWVEYDRQYTMDDDALDGAISDVNDDDLSGEIWAAVEYGCEPKKVMASVVTRSVLWYLNRCKKNYAERKKVLDEPENEC